MKKLFSRAKKENQKGYEESEYQWDGVSEEPMDGAEEDLLCTNESDWKEEGESCGPNAEERLKETEYSEEPELSAEYMEELEYYEDLEMAAEVELEYYEESEAAEEYAEEESEYYEELEAAEEYAEEESEYYEESEAAEEYAEEESEYYEESEAAEEYAEEESEYYEESEAAEEYAEEESEYYEESEAFEEYEENAAEYCEGSESLVESVMDSREPESFVEYAKEVPYGEGLEPFAECAEKEAEYYEEPRLSAEYMEEAEYSGGAEQVIEFAEREDHCRVQESVTKYVEEKTDCHEEETYSGKYNERNKFAAEYIADEIEYNKAEEAFAEYVEEAEYQEEQEAFAEYEEEAEYQEEQEAFAEYVEEAEYQEEQEAFAEYEEEAEYQEEQEAFAEYEEGAEYQEEQETFTEYEEEAEYQEEQEAFAEYVEEAEYQEEQETFAEYAEYNNAQALSREYFGENGEYYGTDDTAGLFGEGDGIYEEQETAEEYFGEMAAYYESEELSGEYGEEAVPEFAAGKAYQEKIAYEEDDACLDVLLSKGAARRAVRGIEPNTGGSIDRRAAQSAERNADRWMEQGTGGNADRRTSQNAGGNADRRAVQRTRGNADRRTARNAGRSTERRTARNAGRSTNRRTVQNAGGQSGKGVSAKLRQIFRNMDILDKVMLASGAAVLILVIVTVSIFVRAHVERNQMADFANVGVQLEGIHMIGEKGIVAVANAEIARLAALVVPTEPPSDSTDPKKDYGEIGYTREVSVEPSFTSIQKDLKIKFINKKSDKLVPNVPFSVTVTAPDGETYIWSDDDMDGIIYKKDIAPGTYQVAMELLTDTRYSDYTVSTSTRSVEVKKEITYEKVDVANEVKKETEVNAAAEDTKKNETVVESSLQDTVAWVESKVIAATYNEVAKSSIPDPLTIVDGGRYLSTGQMELPAQMQTETSALQVLSEVLTQPSTEASPQSSAETPAEVSEEVSAQAPTETPAQTQEPMQVPTEAPTQVPTEAPTQIPTEAPTQVPTEAPTPVPTQAPTPVPVRGTVTVEQTALSGGTGGSLKTKASAGGFAENARIVYSIRTNNPAVATASIDTEGNIEVYAVAVGTAVLTVTANYEGGTAETQAAADITVTIGGIMSLTLDTTSLATHVQESVVVNASISNMISQDPVVTAESSDTNIATVSVDKKAVTVSGVSEGIADITVKYTENGTVVEASCKVTVKKNPRQDNQTPLKDVDGRQLYVMEGSAYREAVYADYYTAQKFFVKGDAKYTGWQTLDGNVYYFTADGSKVTGEQVIQGAKYNFASDGSLVTGDGELGIDVSKWNGTIDWNAVKNSGVSYVIIRCGYRGSSAGKLIEDPKFEANIKGASAAGLKVGVYFFTQAINEIEAVEEASMVLEQIKDYKISYPVFLDVEASGGRGDAIDKDTRTAVCRAFCQTIQSAGYNAGIYSGKLWLEGKIDAAGLNMYKIWLAQYAAAPTYTGRYDMWQYKATGSISGISGDVDMNISYLGY